MSTRFYRRRFLNLRGHHGAAHVMANIDVDGGGPIEWPETTYALLTLADCSRSATLDFTVHDADGARNALHKVHALREVVNDFATALEQVVESTTPR